MNNEIYFCVDTQSFRNLETKGYMTASSYLATESLINGGVSPLVTNSMAHFSFDLIKQGYDIYLCYQDKQVKIEPHMDLSGIGEPGKDLRIGHNIFKMFRAGIFNILIGLY